MKPLLRLDGVSCRRGGRLLFEDLDLKLGPGEALHLRGPNGSGKSSLIRLAAGLLGAEQGSVERSDLALADDALALDGEMPLRGALRFWGGRVDEALDALGLTSLARVPVRFLSTGQAKRATLARVVAADVPLWLLDEPLNGLDSDGAARLHGLVAGHLGRGGAVLAASHGQLGGSWTHMELSA